MFQKRCPALHLTKKTTASRSVKQSLVGTAITLALLSPFELSAPRHDIGFSPATAQAQTQDWQLSESEQKQFNAIEKKLAARQFEEALSLQKKIRNDNLKRIALWAVLSRSPEPVADFETYDSFIASPQTWPRLSHFRRLAEPLLPENWSADRIVAWFDGQAPETLVGASRLHAALNTRGENSKAAEVLHSSWRKGDGAGADDEIEFLRKHSNTLTPEDHIARLDSSIWRQRYRGAERLYDKVPAQYVKLAKARLALIRKSNGVDRLINAVPKELKNDPGLVYDRARWRFDKNRPEAAIELLISLPGSGNYDYTIGDPVWRLRHWAARNQLAQGKTTAAYKLASSHGLESGIGFAEGEFLAGWIALRKLSQPKRAYQHFFALHEGVSSNISKARAAYWAARAALELNNTEWAIRWLELASQYPTTFYGQKAAFLLGSKQPSLTFDKPELSAENKAELNAREITSIIMLLNWDKVRNLQSLFLTRLRLDASSRDELVFATELAHRAGHPNLALRTAKAARHKGQLLPYYLYPDPGLNFEPDNKALVYALIRQESEMNPEAVSHAGARGLMQLIPTTARNVARNENLPYSKNRLTEDPDYNVRLGSAYLKTLINRFDGTQALALAGYNAGPHRVNRWTQSIGSPYSNRENVSTIHSQLTKSARFEASQKELAEQFHLLDWIEQIPFSETRNYVQRVLEGQTIYALANQPTKVASRSPLK
ncbi:lytic transglycosylase domain-containing protein [Kiloniella sp. b19]|uniref:lytic transglycosylase domain-containing protein n=1 Tax=Kiloniella sp. GXU_MW_B19 TaxID=3141326 RepID=UPI0031DC1407